MPDLHFHIGDRVVTIEPLSHAIPTGIRGTVIRVYLSLSDCYDVCFDDILVPHLVFGADLDVVQAAGTGGALDD